MSSIRPLVTITILVIVGVFLFTKINEGPAPVAPGMENTFESAAPPGVPPLATSAKGATNAPAALPSAPAWSGGATAENEPTPQWAGDSAEGVAQSSSVPSMPADLPAVPPIPELPPLAPPADAPSTPVAPPADQPIGLPANVPTAKYPGETSTANPETTAPPTPPPATTANDMTPQPPTAEAVSPVTPFAVDADRYGPIPADPSTVSASEPSFAAIWPVIQGALERQELVQAHEMLSEWYGSPTLSPSEAQRVETLLGQLAGTVVYSTEHRLEPPYTVHAGDTLQTIAQQYEVPWQLLAKINGIPAADLVQPGQQLKVVHGPFSAVVELDKSQLTLLLDGRYAGRFPIMVEPTAAASEGQWVLEQKLLNPSADASGVISASYAAPAAVDRVLVLRNESPAAGGATISITGGPTSPSGPTAVAPAAIRLSPTDVEEVADILSVGSRVTIRR
jgi:LysM repeat protein